MFQNELLGISTTINESEDADPKDIIKTKNALTQTGHYKSQENDIFPYERPSMIEGLKNFQKDNDLKVDGIMIPKGPTEKALAKKASQVASKKQTPVIPKGKSVQQRIQSLMSDNVTGTLQILD